MVDDSRHNLVTRLEARAADTPEAAAIVVTRRGRDHSTSYAELVRNVQQAAAGLRASNVGRGDRVLLLRGVSVEWYVGLLAVWRIGATACLIDPGVGWSRFLSLVHRTVPEAMLTTEAVSLFRWLIPSLRRVPVALSVDRLVRRGARAAAEPPASVPEDHPALLTFTSGSTGEPKAIIRSHALLAAQLDALTDTIDLRCGERDLLTLPVFALANLACGVTTVIADADLRRVGRVRAERVLEQSRRLGVERCTASPAFFDRLIDHAKAQGSRLPFRAVHTGGGPVFVSLLDRLRDTLPDGATVVAVYGSTEAEPIAELDARDITDRDRLGMSRGAGLLAGRSSPAVELRIVELPADAGESPVPPSRFDRWEKSVGEAGEIVVTGAHVVPGYLDGAGDASTKIRVGSIVWHRTGDLGYLDEDGRLWLLGRADGVVTDARGTAYPFAIEAAAMTDHKVRRAALASHRGRRVLLVELRRDIDAATLHDRLYAALRSVLDEVIAVPEVPVDRRHNAKVDYPALRRMLRRRLGPDRPSTGKGIG